MYVPVGAATTRRTAKTITDLVKTHPGLGQDVFVHEHDYNQAMNELVALRADYADLCKRLDAPPSAIALSASVCVPREPTQQMIDSVCNVVSQYAARKIWVQMLAAAPPVTAQEPVGVVTVGLHDHGPFSFRETAFGADHLPTGDTPLYAAPVSPRMEVGTTADRRELENIANAERFNRERFRDDSEFADWVQSRARHAISTRHDKNSEPHG